MTMQPIHKKFAVASLVGMIFIGCCLRTEGQEAEKGIQAIDAKWNLQTKEIEAVRNNFHNEIDSLFKHLEDKRHEMRNAEPGFPAEPITAEKKKEYRLAQNAIRKWYAKGGSVVGYLCENLDEEAYPVVIGRGTRFSYVENFPTAQTLVEMDPCTAKVIVRNAWRYETPKLQFLVGAILNELDGFELAKSRLDIAINELPQDHTLGEALKIKATKNLQAIRKLFDKKDAFEAKRK